MNTPHVKVVKFWVWLNSSPVRLTLRENWPLHWRRGGPTDEGWESEETSWYLSQNFVSREHASDGVDCDGRLSRYDASSCHVCKLADLGYPDSDGVTYPQWQHGESSQRDYTAERAGY